MGLWFNQKHEKKEINHENEMKSLALRFESFRSQKLEDITAFHSYFHIQREIGFLWASSCNIPKGWIKRWSIGNGAIELDEGFLNLLLHTMEPPPVRNLQASTKNHKLGLWRKIQEVRATLLELTMNEVEDVDVVHEVVLVLPSSFFLSFFNPFCNPFSL